MAPAAPQPEAVVEAEVVTEAVQAPAVVSAAGSRSLGTVKVNALAMIAAEPDSTFLEPFPTIELKGGNAGGNVIPSKSTAKNWPEVAATLPQGKQPFKGILMGARTFAVAWPSDYDSRGENERPSLSAAIPLSDGDATAVLLTGCENFQFCPKDQKVAKWNVANGGPGHLRPFLQLLVWSPTLREPVVVSSCGLLATYRKMAQEVVQFVNAENGALDPVPSVFTPTTEPWYDANVYHYFKGSWWINDAAAEAAWQDFHEWSQDVMANRPDVMTAVMDWVEGRDAPLDEDAANKLKQAANMVNPRRGRRPASPTA